MDPWRQTPTVTFFFFHSLIWLLLGHSLDVDFTENNFSRIPPCSVLTFARPDCRAFCRFSVGGKSWWLLFLQTVCTYVKHISRRLNRLTSMSSRPSCRGFCGWSTIISLAYLISKAESFQQYEKLFKAFSCHASTRSVFASSYDRFMTPYRDGWQWWHFPLELHWSTFLIHPVAEAEREPYPQLL